MTDSRQLLEDYARHQSEAAFRELVTRYLNLVYSCALRLVDGDAHRAEDVAQVVFADLARKAGGLSAEVMLGGWLHRHTCFVAANTMRGERRRLAREREAVEMNSLHEEDTHLDFARLAPLLDETIDQLEEADRTAILLRFFEQKDFCAVGQALGSSEEASRKRVSRALDQMRDLLSRHGIRTTAAALSVAVSANAVQAAPAGLAAKISAALLSGTAATTATIITATKTMAMTTLQKIAVTAALIATVSVGIYEASQAHDARIEASKLQTELASLSGQLQQLQKEREQGTNEAAELRAENSRLKANSNQQELLQLRGKVAQLTASSKDLPGPVTQQWLNKINVLKQTLQDRPDKSIPELQFLTEKDWGDAAWSADLETDDGIRQALCKLRENAQNTFLNDLMKAAIKKYLAANNNLLPTDLLQVKPYFEVEVTDDMLNRYALIQTGTPDPHAKLVESIALPVDDEYDTYHEISLNGASGSGVGSVSGQISYAMSAYAQANNGQSATTAAQLAPYVKPPLDAPRIQKYLDKFPSAAPR